MCDKDCYICVCAFLKVCLNKKIVYIYAQTSQSSTRARTPPPPPGT